MSDPDDHAYDDQGNVVLIRYAPLPKQSSRHSSSINPVSSAELALIRQRRAEEKAKRERQKARSRAEEKKQDKERAAHFKISSPISPQKRAMQLDDLSEDKRNADGADHD